MKRYQHLLAVIVAAAQIKVAVAQPLESLDPPKAKVLDQEGEQAYGAGDFAKAIPLFKRAYHFDPDVDYLFNLAQAYRRNRDCSLAIATFELYLKVAPNAADRKVVETDLLPEMKAGLSCRPPPKPIDPGRSLRKIGLITAGSGLLVGLVGTYFAIHAHSLQDEVESCRFNCTAAFDSGENAALVGKVAFGLAGAAIATGGVMYMLGRHPTTEVSPLAVVPIDGGAIAFTGGHF